jgi:hypothetical protein
MDLAIDRRVWPHEEVCRFWTFENYEGEQDLRLEVVDCRQVAEDCSDRNRSFSSTCLCLDYLLLRVMDCRVEREKVRAPNSRLKTSEFESGIKTLHSSFFRVGISLMSWVREWVIIPSLDFWHHWHRILRVICHQFVHTNQLAVMPGIRRWDIFVQRKNKICDDMVLLKQRSSCDRRGIMIIELRNTLIRSRKIDDGEQALIAIILANNCRNL